MATMICNLKAPSHKLVRFPNLLLVSQLGNLTIKKHNSTPLSLHIHDYNVTNVTNDQTE